MTAAQPVINGPVAVTSGSLRNGCVRLPSHQSGFTGGPIYTVQMALHGVGPLDSACEQGFLVLCGYWYLFIQSVNERRYSSALESQGW